MRWWECGLEFDELNESQPLCPGCGQPPSSKRDHPDFSGVLDEAPPFAIMRACEAESENSFDTEVKGQILVKSADRCGRI
jgi:hypothetical protein